MPTFVESFEPRRLLTAAITGHTYEDVNADGAYTAADKRLAGVTAYVDLNRDGKCQSAEPHATSDGTGAYAITGSGLTVGQSYALGFVFASGYTPSAAPAAVTLKASPTSVADAGAWRYATVKINGFLDPNDNGTQDPGETPPTDVTYWDDANQNNVPDPGEAKLAGNGTMTLKPGLHLIWPQYTGEEYELTGGTNTLYVTVTSGQSTTLQFGYFHPAFFTGHVYQDTNHNGKYDPGEGLGNRMVYADGNNNGRSDAGEFGDQTAPDGSFTFHCDIGTYKIREVTPKGWADGASPSITVKTGTSAISSGYALESHAIATSTTGVITGTIYTDTNGNGKQDSGEATFAGDPSEVFIDLDHDNQYDPDEEPLYQYSGTGTFTISDLKPGTYRIGIEGYGVSTTKSHDVTVSANKTSSAGAYGMQPRFYIDVTALQDDNRNGQPDPVLENNAGDKISGDDALNGRVIYIDSNNNGKRDAGETYQTTGDTEYGGSLFDLAPGTYTFREELPAGWYETARGSEGLSATATFTADGKVRLPGDAQPFASSWFNTPDQYGLYFLSAPNLLVHGRVFNDANGNGKQDAGETAPAVANPGGSVVYADANNNGRQDTGEAAAYLNTDGTFAIALAPGTYTIRQALNSGWTQTFASGASITVAKSTTSAPSVVLGRHAGTSAPKFFEVGGWAYVDENRNGRHDELEDQDEKLDYWSIYVDTDHSGDVSDGDLYYSSVSSSKWGMTLPADGKTYRIICRNEGNTPFLAPASGYYDVSSTTDGQVLNLDFSVAPDTTVYVPETAGISGVAFNDANKNGKQDAGETVAANKTVWLDLDDDGVMDLGETAVSTDSAGRWAFGNLAAGTYHVRRVYPSGYVESTPARYITVAVGQSVSGVTIGSKAV